MMVSETKAPSGQNPDSLAPVTVAGFISEF